MFTLHSSSGRVIRPGTVGGMPAPSALGLGAVPHPLVWHWRVPAAHEGAWQLLPAHTSQGAARAHAHLFQCKCKYLHLHKEVSQ